MSVADRLRELGASGLFRELGEPATLLAGARRLAGIAYEADSLGELLSVIAVAGLAVPILARAPGQAALLADAQAGRSVLAVAITERHAGSDALAMKTALIRGPGGLLLRGAKWHITNAPEADAAIVFAVDATSDDRFLTAVVVRRDDPGVRLGPALDLIGASGSPTGELFFEDVPIAEDRIVGRPQDGRALLDLAFVRERALAPWPLIGKMERVLEECLDHVEARAQFGSPLREFQYVQEKIVSSFDLLLHTRQLAERAVRSIADGHPEAAIASLAKATAADAAVHVFRAAIELHGSYGVQTDKHYGQWLNDAVCAQIAGGTRETHKKVVFGELRLERARARRGLRGRLLRTAEGGDHG